jgi:FAD binding domain
MSQRTTNKRPLLSNELTATKRQPPGFGEIERTDQSNVRQPRLRITRVAPLFPYSPAPHISRTAHSLNFTAKAQVFNPLNSTTPPRATTVPKFSTATMTTDNKQPDTEVVIVGAGPVGLIIGLMIAKQGIKCTLLEAAGEIIQSPRAMAYGPAAVVELERVGVAAECREIGMEPSDYDFTLKWITIDNKLVADLSSKLMEGYPPVLCGQHRVAEVILKHLQQYDNAKVLWNHKVVGIEQDKETVTAICETENGQVKVTGQYLVGADGARSTVRKLIGCTFDGFTYDKMVVATNVFYPFREHGFSSGQFIIHPEHFAMVSPSRT